MIISKLRKRLSFSSERSKLAIKNIVASFILKITSIITSLLVVPLTIDYVDGTQYGIWLTISSIVGWANFFDLGLSNGLKNKFAEAKAKNNILLAREYLSTTYVFITILMTLLFGLIWLMNNHLNLASILNVSQDYRLVLHNVFIILAFFFCMNMIVNTFVKMLEADQRPAIASAIAGIGQVLSLAMIYILTKTTQGSLINLATYFSGIPIITMLVASVIMFLFTRYRKYAPSIRLFKPFLIKDLLQLGLKFFFIYLCLIVIFQLMNIVLSRECGALSVTQYNISYKYFSIVYMAFMIIVAPMWAAFTDAYTKKDFQWMRNVLVKFEKSIKWVALFCVILLFVSGFSFKIWIGDSVEIGFILSLGTMVYVFTQILGGLYMHLINGIGAVQIQFLIYLLFALISYPLMTFSCRLAGPVGIIFIPTIVYLFQAIVGRKQIWLIINQKASGIWLK